MILPLICPDISNSDFDKGFSSYSYYEERIVPVKNDIGLFTYWVTDDNFMTDEFESNFVNEYFETQSFFDNKHNILMKLSNSIFEKSRFLDDVEEVALNKAFFNSLSKRPTLNGRK